MHYRCADCGSLSETKDFFHWCESKDGVVGKPSNSFICEFCGKSYVVASLARSCEEKHLESEHA